MCETRPRSNRRRARVLPATLAAWRWYRPDGTRRPMPYCALRTTAACTVPHPVSPSPQTNPPDLPGPSRSSDAAPDSGYRRGLREIVYDSGTTWADSLAEDLKVGRDVFVIGLKLPGGKLEATRVTVYEVQAPVRMGPSSRCIGPAKEAH